MGPTGDMLRGLAKGSRAISPVSELGLPPER